MKKLVSLLLTFAVVFTLCGCGNSKKAFFLSKDAYDKVTTAYEITDEFGSDVYEAWRLAIYEKDTVKKGGTKYLSNELNLTEAELNEGTAYALATVAGNNWGEMDESEKDIYRTSVKANSGYVFSLYSEVLFSFCIQCVVGAYVTNGEVEEAQQSLDEAKSLMKELSDKYSDYEHYPSLKGYYTTTKSFFDFCQAPTGSFNQLVDTMNNYRNAVRDYKADLDYIFE